MAAQAGHAAFIQDLVRGRNAVRAFRPDAVPQPMLRDVFDLAQWAPSNCNTQPWTVYLASGETRRRLAAKLIERMDKAQPDIPYNADTYPPLFKARRADHLTHKQNALGIAHESRTRRHEILTANLTSFGAPHLALLYMPAWGNEREAGDIGIYAQTLMLVLSAHGIASCPQTSLGLYAGTIRAFFNVPMDLKLMFGVAFGYEDVANPGSRLTQTRAPSGAVVKTFD